MVGMVDSEHIVFHGRGAELVGEPVGEVEADRLRRSASTTLDELSGLLSVTSRAAK
jgi:hypothetical protein